MREYLNTEVTRKQFLQYLAGATLMVLGLNNLVALLTGGRSMQPQNFIPPVGPNPNDGFGARRFGV